jgi:hypothetical protein
MDERVKQVVERERQEQSGMGAAGCQMPLYQSHKTVYALKIAEVLDPTEPQNESDGSRIIVPADEGYAPFRVAHEYVRKHNPQAGGYYVVYDDGYASWSPAKAFEEGYTRV